MMPITYLHPHQLLLDGLSFIKAIVKTDVTKQIPPECRSAFDGSNHLRMKLTQS